MLSNFPLLSLLIWVPIIGGIWLLLLGRNSEAAIRPVALVFSILTFVLSFFLYIGFDIHSPSMQFVESIEWIPVFQIQYALGVDGISMPMIILTSFVTILVIISAWNVIQYKVSHYMSAFLIMTGLMNGVFAALDAILFYVLWEAMLIPMFLIIGIWGGYNRIYATVKFFLYTFFGSVLMLIALLYLFSKTGSFSILSFHQQALGFTEQILIFIAFFVAFAVKVPMWPVHTWLPDAHVEAPTGGSVILAAIMLKMGTYGFLRFSLPITPDASKELDWFIIGISLIAVVYISLIALMQQDMKKLIAYSSIAHMGFVTLGFFVIFQIVDNTGLPNGAIMAIEGGIVQMVSHGFISGALFLCVGVLYDRMHSRQIADYGGVANMMPKFTLFLVIFAMANAGLPGTSGFVGEFLVILASMQANFWVAFIAATTLILGAAYTLWMIKRVMFGVVANENVAKLSDITLREQLILGTLAIVILFFGIYPNPLLEIMHPTIEQLLVHVTQSKL